MHALINNIIRISVRRPADTLCNMDSHLQETNFGLDVLNVCTYTLYINRESSPSCRLHTHDQFPNITCPQVMYTRHFLWWEMDAVALHRGKCHKLIKITGLVKMFREQFGAIMGIGGQFDWGSILSSAKHRSACPFRYKRVCCVFLAEGQMKFLFIVHMSFIFHHLWGWPVAAATIPDCLYRRKVLTKLKNVKIDFSHVCNIMYFLTLFNKITKIWKFILVKLLRAFVWIP